MRRVRLSVGSGPLLTALVAETPAEQSWGLQGLPWLRDDEGMYFPSPGGQAPMQITMKGVTFPIDVLFFDKGRVAKVVHRVPPGEQRVWSYGDWAYGQCSGVLEVRGGWVRDYQVQLGDPLSVSS